MRESNTHYCAACGKVIVTLHIVIPVTGLRYHKACKPIDSKTQVLAKPGEKVYH